ncbi:MAG: DUF4080 domain-containing protein [Victivallales bacterium]|nr:DUF4080 domain-containing protein [Victivallales bacterium]
MTTTPRKIVFIGVNSSYSHSMLSYGFVRAWNEPFLPDHRWQLLETTINDDEAAGALAAVAAQPEVILGTAYLFNRDFLLRLLARVRALLPTTPIYLGGPEFLGDNAAFLRHFPAVTGVVRGDESSLHRIIAGDPDAPGLCRLDADGNYHDHGTAAMPDTTPIPSPYLAGYFERGKPFYQLETSRGCGGNCTFCTSSRSRGVRYLPLDRVRAELTVLAAAGAREIRLLDRTFNEPPDRAIALLRLFREEFPRLRFHLEINPARLTPELLELLHELPPGQLHLEAGVQTFNDAVLRTVRRPATAAKTATGLRQLHACGNFELHTDLIAGLPEQGLKDVIADLSRLIELEPEEIQLETLKILPGTPLAKRPPAGMVWNPEPPYEVLQTATMTATELHRTRLLSKIIDHYYNAPELRRLFAWAWRRENGFAHDFPLFLHRCGNPAIRVSPQKRLDNLAEFAAATGNHMLAELVRFVWLVNGLPPEQYGLTPHKTVRGEIHDAAGAIINRVRDNHELKRYFAAEFPFNAAAILAAVPTAWDHQPHRYLFYPRHGQRLGRLVEIAPEPEIKPANGPAPAVIAD